MKRFSLLVFGQKIVSQPTTSYQNTTTIFGMQENDGFPVCTDFGLFIQRSDIVRLQVIHRGVNVVNLFVGECAVQRGGLSIVGPSLRMQDIPPSRCDVFRRRVSSEENMRSD